MDPKELRHSESLKLETPERQAAWHSFGTRHDWKLALLLLYHKRILRKSSPLEPWINTLPSVVDTPIRWTDSKLSELEDEEFVALVTGDDCPIKTP